MAFDKSCLNSDQRFRAHLSESMRVSIPRGGSCPSQLTRHRTTAACTDSVWKYFSWLSTSTALPEELVCRKTPRASNAGLEPGIDYVRNIIGNLFIYETATS